MEGGRRTEIAANVIIVCNVAFPTLSDSAMSDLLTIVMTRDLYCNHSCWRFSPPLWRYDASTSSESANEGLMETKREFVKAMATLAQRTIGSQRIVWK
jgi:hypothetical protein